MDLWETLASREFGLYTGILFTFLGVLSAQIGRLLRKTDDYRHLESIMRAMAFSAAWFAFLAFVYTTIRGWQDLDWAIVGLAAVATAVGIIAALTYAGIRGPRTGSSGMTN